MDFNEDTFFKIAEDISQGRSIRIPDIPDIEL